jgi:predicted Zn finger-like uncharacterized protein
MSKNKLKYRAICPDCGKAFDLREEGFTCDDGKIRCAKCTKFGTFFNYKED